MCSENKSEDIKLTKREKEILLYVSKGINNIKISENMNISIHTVKVHIRSILKKLNAKNRTEAAIKGARYNLIDIFI